MIDSQDCAIFCENFGQKIFHLSILYYARHSAQNCSHTMFLSKALYKVQIFLIYRQILQMFQLIYKVDNAALPSNEQNGSKFKSIAEKKVKVLAAPWGSLDSYLVYVKHFWGHAYFYVFIFYRNLP